MLKKVAHIGIGVKNLDDIMKLYEDIFLLKSEGCFTGGGMKVAFYPVGDTSLEFLQSLSPDGVIGKFVAKKGEGVHHIAYEVDDIEKCLVDLKSKGIELIDEKPRPGAHDSKVAFIHPKGTFGVLIELVEPKK